MAEKKIVPEGYKEKTERSVIPIYAFGIVVLIYALCFPFYNAWHYIKALVAAGFVSFILALFIPKKVTYIPEEPRETGDPNADEFLKNGRAALEEIRKANDKIKSLEISRKIYDIEDVCKKIFAHVEKYPKKEKKLRRFMDYYLPTTLKLLNSYAEAEAQGISGENLDGTKERISGMLTKVKQAFEKQLDALFGDMSLDVAADITVMENLMASQGLLNDNINKEDKGNE